MSAPSETAPPQSATSETATSEAAPSQAGSLEVVINGETASLDGGLSLGSWLQSVGRDPRTVAIERNGEIVPRANYDQTPIEAGDRLEIVHFVQGG